MAWMGMKALGGKGWLSVFGAGVTLGALLFGMKAVLSIEEGGVAAIYQTGAMAVESSIEEQPLYTLSQNGSIAPARTSYDWSDKETIATASPSGDTERIEPGLEPDKDAGEREKAHDAESSGQNAVDSAVERAEDDKAVVRTESVKDALSQLTVRVYRTKQKKVESVPLEDYVLGVLASEMPIDFELEALKAQAIAARTYIMRRLYLQDTAGSDKLKYDVTDTVQNQVYQSRTELEKLWSGEEKESNLAKLSEAVEETKGLIVAYEGLPIEAAFFSTSNGYTENSEEYWDLSLPYLRSVASPWDKELSPRYKQEVELSKSGFYHALGLTGKAAGSKLSMKVTEWSEGKRIKTIKINGKSFSGREVREKLGLASSAFSWKIEKDHIILTTLGLGHGVGMSQWGADGMAREGASAQQILQHYYTGAEVEQASKLSIIANS
ncbi:stage II sporulation protein D [Paenibacillus sp. HB172176]|uniref:stage II sporulation protein D n=1 Tax=Paenibacillus sp. HB172176 TaxID=2493690 RepID=UPI001F110C76|nr:stage II sporulation protein D [Paenibacillus sp. HB172176]